MTFCLAGSLTEDLTYYWRIVMVLWRTSYIADVIAIIIIVLGVDNWISQMAHYYLWRCFGWWRSATPRSTKSGWSRGGILLVFAATFHADYFWTTFALIVRKCVRKWIDRKIVSQGICPNNNNIILWVVYRRLLVLYHAETPSPSARVQLGRWEHGNVNVHFCTLLRIREDPLTIRGEKLCGIEDQERERERESHWVRWAKVFLIWLTKISNWSFGETE